MPWSNWTSIKSDGTIPDQLLPCEAFQARWFLEWDYDITDPARMSDTLNGRWKWQIVPVGGGDHIFVSETKVRVMVVWLYFGFGISGVVWWWDSSGDRVLTTIPVWSNRPLDGQGNPIWAGEGGNWSDYSHPSAEGTEQPYCDPGSGNQFADPTVYVQTFWHGPIYNIAIPQNSKWEVPFHNVGATWLIKLANLQMRTRKGGDTGGCIDVPGIARNGHRVSQVATQLWTQDGGVHTNLRRIWSDVGSPQLDKDRENVLYCLGEKGTNWMLWRSENDGYTWDAGMSIWPSGYSNARMVPLPSGGMLYIAAKGNVVYSQRSDGAGRQTVCSSGTPPFSLVYDDRWGAMVIDSTGKVWRSENLLTWEQA